MFVDMVSEIRTPFWLPQFKKNATKINRKTGQTIFKLKECYFSFQTNVALSFTLQIKV